MAIFKFNKLIPRQTFREKFFFFHFITKKRAIFRIYFTVTLVPENIPTEFKNDVLVAYKIEVVFFRFGTLFEFVRFGNKTQGSNFLGVYFPRQFGYFLVIKFVIC